MKTARRLAFAAYQVWQADPQADWLAAIGSTKHHVGFAKIASEWLATQSTDADYKAAVIRKFLIPYFDGQRSVTDVATINDEMIADYKIWRLNFWKTVAVEQVAVPATVRSAAKQAAHFGVPSANTLNRESPTLRQILGYAGKKGYFGTKPVPTVPTEASKANPRPAFLGDDFDKLAAAADEWTAEAETDEVRWRRQLLSDWIWVGRYTGIRFPHEAAQLSWGDIRLDTNLLHIAETTKTGRRDVPLNELAATRLSEMLARRTSFAKTHNQTFNQDEPVFVLLDGCSQCDLGKLFNQLMERCNFAVRADGVAHSPYGLRHTFATFALAEGLTGDHVAEMMGTSVKMLNVHYKHGTIEQTRRYLRERGRLNQNEPGAADWKPLTIVDPDALPEGHSGRRKLILAS
ncbi:tyrosine-type recombinase/integrase [Sphingomonas sp.]|uniref:tyrosine-type recombinase/integrase n=1 Tax=Sphingomonas sp. TaxID=28214 RepID=UPI002ED9D954